MRFRIDVKSFLVLLKTMKPKSARTKALRDPTVKITGGGTTIILVGDFENSASAPAEILEPGTGVIALTPCIRLLATYPTKALVEVKAEPGAFWLDKMRIPVSQ